MPEIVSSEGRGDRERVINLMFKSIRLSFVIISVVVFPILFQTETILNIWLKNPPEYAVLFCRIMLVAFLIMRIVGSFDSAICATGRIKNYQITMLSLAFCTIFLASALFYWGLGIYNICGVIIGYSVIFDVVSVYFCKKLVHISIKQWLKQVVRPISITVMLNVLTGVLLLYLTSGFGSITRLFMVVTAIIVFATVINWIYLTDQDEKIRIKKMISSVKQRIIKR